VFLKRLENETIVFLKRLENGTIVFLERLENGTIVFLKRLENGTIVFLERLELVCFPMESIRCQWSHHNPYLDGRCSERKTQETQLTSVGICEAQETRSTYDLIYK